MRHSERARKLFRTGDPAFVRDFNAVSPTGQVGRDAGSGTVEKSAAKSRRAVNAGRTGNWRELA
jgi:hypothetical protein